MKLRKLVLTSPLTHGPDVTALQRALNKQNARVAVDGRYGPSTKAAVHSVAWRLGLGHTDALPAVQRIIENPKRRSPLDYRRARQRAAEAKRNGHGLAAVVHKAALHLGVAEHPAGSNWGEPVPAAWERNFGVQGGPWCGCFAGSMVKECGGHPTSRVAYCPFIEQDAKAGVNGFDRWVPWNGNLHEVGPGWLVLYDWTGNHSFPEHVGIVREPVGSTVRTIEGNTGGSNPSDGGMVAEADRPLSFVVGFARPRF